MFVALNILALVWVIATWVKSGFFAALNLWLYGVLVGFGTMVYLAQSGRLVN